jgi:hypothetical protein
MAHILTSVTGDAADKVPVQRALLSVSDKAGLIELAGVLAGFGVELLSTVKERVCDVLDAFRS